MRSCAAPEIKLHRGDAESAEKDSERISRCLTAFLCVLCVSAVGGVLTNLKITVFRRQRP